MSTTYPLHAATAAHSATESHVVRITHTMLRYLFAAVPIVAGADKFTNLLTHWEAYLNPLALSIVPVTAPTFLHIVGAIEIAAGILVFVKPRFGSFVVMGWLFAISLQLIIWGRFLDVAVRDIVIALSGPLILARLTPIVERVSAVPRRDTDV